MNIEHSQASSRSSSRVSVADVSTRKKSVVDNLFPLFDQMTQKVELSSACYLLPVIWAGMQIIVTSFWQGHNNTLGTAEPATSVIQWIIILFSLKPDKATETGELIQFGIYIGLLILLVCVVFFQQLYFFKKRRFITKLLYPSRFVLEAIPMVMVTPSAAFTGSLFMKLFGDNVRTTDIVMFVFMVIIYAGYLTLFIYIMNLFGISPFLATQTLAAHDIQPFIIHISVNSVFQLVSIVIDHFPPWVLHPIVLLHAANLIYLYLDFIYRPFMDIPMNFIGCTIIITGVIMDFIRMVAFCFDSFNTNIYGGLLLVALVLGIITNVLVFSLQNRNLKKMLFTENNFEDLTDSDKVDFFKSLKLDISYRKANLVLHYSIEQCLPFLTDFSLIKFLLEYHSSNSKIQNQLIRLVAFFPGETRLLNIFYNEFIKKKSHPMKERFLIMQITRIKYLRQSSSSMASAEKLKELIQSSKEILEKVRSFWMMPEVSMVYLMNLNKHVTTTRSLWDESLIEFPNSTTHSEGYCNFLVECCTDFSNAILQKHRIALIEGGRNFCVDLCFRHFVHLYPQYLKKRVIDLNGNIIKASKKSGKNSSNSGMKQRELDTSSSLTAIDAAIEEEIGKNLVTHARLRIALQSSTKDKKAKNSKKLFFFIFATAAVMLAASLFVFIFFHNFFDQRLSMTERVEYSNMVYYNMFISNLCLIMAASDDHGQFQYQNASARWSKADKKQGTRSILDFDVPWREDANKYSIQSRDSYNNFLHEIALMSKDAIDVYSLLSNLMAEEVNLTYCADGYIVPPVLVNLKTLIIYILMSQTLTAGNNESDDWYNTYAPFCSIEKSTEQITKLFDSVRESLVNFNYNEYVEFDQTIIITVYIIGPLLFVLIYVPILIYNILFTKEINNFSKILLSFNSDIKKEAMGPLLKQTNEDNVQEDNATNTQATKRKEICSPSTQYILFLTFLIVLHIVIVELHLNISIDDTNEMFNYINLWTSNSRRRKSIIASILYYMCQAVLISNSSVYTNPTIVTSVVSQQIGIYQISRLDTVNNIMILGYEDYPPCLHFNQQIDDLTLKQQCEPDHEDKGFHELYRCVSGHQLIAYFKDITYEINTKIPSFGGRMDNEHVLDFLHICLSHLIPTLIKIDDQLSYMAEEALSGFKIDEVGYLIGEMVIILVYVVIHVLILKKYDACYDTLISIMRHVSPIDLISNKDLMKYLMNRSTDGNSNSNITSCSVIQKSNDCILLANLTGIIEVINPSVTILLGYTPEQLLGQTFIAILDDNERERISNQVQLIRNNECAPVYEDHTVCISDNELKYPCAITILGMHSNSSAEITSFVIILRDESVLVQQQSDAENAKKRSESLLYQILPRSIVVKLNQGEKDISFTVPSATIMFIDIVKFSEYASNLNPQEIMSNLSHLFGAFDEAIKKYPLLYKIKLIGDVYMCAGGLFDLEAAPSAHAEQMIRFGLECFSLLDETNMKLNAILNVRIGINTGGPLIAGVLGTDKPVFDIIGDPINIASRLQSTDFPGNIQISEDTYNLITDTDLYVEPRGEVFLKGKGKKQAYLVRPNKAGCLFQLSSSEIPVNHE